MALLEYNVYKPVCPEGEYTAVCNDIEDKWNVTRVNYKTKANELVNVTQFTFRVTAVDKEYDVTTKEMKINGHPKSNLCLFLTSWKGEELPKPGTWDYCEMKGETAIVSIKHAQSKDDNNLFFANIACIRAFDEKTTKTDIAPF